MAVVAQIVIPGVTKEQYDRLRAAVGWLDKAPDGGLSHVTWWEGDDCQNVDAWESEEALGAFAETRLAPGMAQVGITAEPKITVHPAHEVFLPQAATITAS